MYDLKAEVKRAARALSDDEIRNKVKRNIIKRREGKERRI